MYLSPSMKRSKRRHDDWRKAIRKREICRQVYGWEWYDDLHRYSKNKIQKFLVQCLEWYIPENCQQGIDSPLKMTYHSRVLQCGWRTKRGEKTGVVFSSHYYMRIRRICKWCSDLSVLRSIAAPLVLLLVQIFYRKLAGLVQIFCCITC